MSHTVNLYAAVDALVNGIRHLLGSKSTPVTITLTAEEVSDFQYTIAASTVQAVWSASSTENPNVAFNLIAIITNKDIDVEMVCDANNGVGRVVWQQRVPENRVFIIPSKVAYAATTPSFATGTADLIETINIKNTAGADAKVQVLILN